MDCETVSDSDQAAAPPGALRGAQGCATAATPATSGHGPGPSSSKDAAAKFTQQCTALRCHVLARLQWLAEDADALSLQAALSQWRLTARDPALTNHPPAVADDCGSLTLGPAPGSRPPEPEAVHGRESATPEPADAVHGTGSASPDLALTSCPPAAADGRGSSMLGPAPASSPPEPGVVRGSKPAAPEQALSSCAPEPAAALAQPSSHSQFGRPQRQRRVGLCLNGLILDQGSGLLALGAVAGVARLVREFGSEQVNIISMAHGDADVSTRLSLLEASSFYFNTGFSPARLHWTQKYWGPESTGPRPRQSQVSHAIVS